jgi:hypothetical protein
LRSKGNGRLEATLAMIDIVAHAKERFGSSDAIDNIADGIESYLDSIS